MKQPPRAQYTMTKRVTKDWVMVTRTNWTIHHTISAIALLKIRKSNWLIHLCGKSLKFKKSVRKNRRKETTWLSSRKNCSYWYKTIKRWSFQISSLLVWASWVVVTIIVIYCKALEGAVIYLGLKCSISASWSSKSYLWTLGTELATLLLISMQMVHNKTK